MKKSIFALIFIIMSIMTILSISLSVNAAPLYMKPNAPISVPSASPKIDGDITLGEGWSERTVFNYDTVSYNWGMNPLTTNADIYFSADSKGLYYAANITEGITSRGPIESYDIFGDTLICSTGYDDLNKNYGFNGDVFGLMLDIDNTYINAGLTTSADRSPWYLIGIFEDGSAKMYRENVSSADITDKVDIKAKITDSGWSFEAFIPWEQIKSDAEEMYASKNLKIDLTDFSSKTHTIKASCLYMDRFYDPESGKVDTWGRFITSDKNTMDNFCIQNYGITLNLLSSHEHTKTRCEIISPKSMSDIGTERVYCAVCDKLLYSNPIPVDNAISEFDDVSENAWYASAVKFCNYREYMLGTGNRMFSPETTLTREMFITSLWTMNFIPRTNPEPYDETKYKASGFTDVKTGSWCEKAINWAYAEGITAGISKDMFGTGKPITREEMVTMLYKFIFFNNNVAIKDTASGRKEFALDKTAENLNGFTDALSVAPFANEAMRWAVGYEVIAGTSEGVLSPKSYANRAQSAKVFEKFILAYKVSNNLI